MSSRHPAARLANPTVSVQDILDRVVRYMARSLEDHSVELCTNPNLAPRVRSSIDQETISRALKQYTHASDWFQERELELEIPPNDFWYDFAIRGRDLFLPVNLKVSSLKGAGDNVSAKDGLFFALTGVDPRDANTNTWERFCTSLARNLSTLTTADYFFLIVSKKNIGDVFWTSLKSLKQLQPNGNNLPFQCDWQDNRERIYRTHDEAARYLLGITRRSFELRADAFMSFQRHIDPILAP